MDVSRERDQLHDDGQFHDEGFHDEGQITKEPILSKNVNVDGKVYVITFSAGTSPEAVEKILKQIEKLVKTAVQLGLGQQWSQVSFAKDKVEGYGKNIVNLTNKLSHYDLGNINSIFTIAVTKAAAPHIMHKTLEFAKEQLHSIAERTDLKKLQDPIIWEREVGRIDRYISQWTNLLKNNVDSKDISDEFIMDITGHINSLKEYKQGLALMREGHPLIFHFSQYGNLSVKALLPDYDKTKGHNRAEIFVEVVHLLKKQIGNLDLDTLKHLDAWVRREYGIQKDILQSERAKKRFFHRKSIGMQSEIVGKAALFCINKLNARFVEEKKKLQPLWPKPVAKKAEIQDEKTAEAFNNIGKGVKLFQQLIPTRTQPVTPPPANVKDESLIHTSSNTTLVNDADETLFDDPGATLDPEETWVDYPPEARHDFKVISVLEASVDAPAAMVDEPRPQTPPDVDLDSPSDDSGPEIDELLNLINEGYDSVASLVDDYAMEAAATSVSSEKIDGNFEARKEALNTLTKLIHRPKMVKNAVEQLASELEKNHKNDQATREFGALLRSLGVAAGKVSDAFFKMKSVLPNSPTREQIKDVIFGLDETLLADYVVIMSKVHQKAASLELDTECGSFLSAKRESLFRKACVKEGEELQEIKMAKQYRYENPEDALGVFSLIGVTMIPFQMGNKLEGAVDKMYEDDLKKEERLKLLEPLKEKINSLNETQRKADLLTTIDTIGGLGSSSYLTKTKKKGLKVESMGQMSGVLMAGIDKITTLNKEERRLGVTTILKDLQDGYRLGLINSVELASVLAKVNAHKLTMNIIKGSLPLLAELYKLEDAVKPPETGAPNADMRALNFMIQSDRKKALKEMQKAILSQNIQAYENFDSREGMSAEKSTISTEQTQLIVAFITDHLLSVKNAKEMSKLGDFYEELGLRCVDNGEWGSAHIIASVLVSSLFARTTHKTLASLLEKEQTSSDPNAPRPMKILGIVGKEGLLPISVLYQQATKLTEELEKRKKMLKDEGIKEDAIEEDDTIKGLNKQLLSLNSDTRRKLDELKEKKASLLTDIGSTKWQPFVDAQPLFKISQEEKGQIEERVNDVDTGDKKSIEIEVRKKINKMTDLSAEERQRNFDKEVEKQIQMKIKLRIQGKVDSARGERSKEIRAK